MTKLQTIIFLSSLTVYSQQISYNLLLKNKCSNEIESSNSYSLEKDGITYTAFDNSPLVLPKKGIYKLSSIDTDEVYEIKIDKSINSDTLVKPMIQIQIRNGVSYKKNISNKELRKIKLYMATRYFICEKECNGFQVDYYSNGNLRMSGTFENGISIGLLKEYYQNGKIKATYFYKKNAQLKKLVKYDENGNIITD